MKLIDNSECKNYIDILNHEGTYLYVSVFSYEMNDLNKHSLKKLEYDLNALDEGFKGNIIEVFPYTEENKKEMMKKAKEVAESLQPSFKFTTNDFEDKDFKIILTEIAICDKLMDTDDLIYRYPIYKVNYRNEIVNMFEKVKNIPEYIIREYKMTLFENKLEKDLHAYYDVLQKLSKEEIISSCKEIALKQAIVNTIDERYPYEEDEFILFTDLIDDDVDLLHSMYEIINDCDDLESNGIYYSIKSALRKRCVGNFENYITNDKHYPEF